MVTRRESSTAAPGGERRGQRTGQRGQQELLAVHAGMVERMRAKVNVHPGIMRLSTRDPFRD
jgi:hypothetical protein